MTRPPEGSAAIAHCDTHTSGRWSPMITPGRQITTAAAENKDKALPPRRHRPGEIVSSKAIVETRINTSAAAPPQAFLKHNCNSFFLQPT
uniref:Uncharacterized protein n=1 Tax=Panagrellus redivivus TaxID=6233 RepID=A0A7E4VFM8_PANRE